MPFVVVEEKQRLRRMIDLMGPEDVLRMLDYAAVRRDEPAVPLSEVVRDYEDKYGPLDRG